MLFWQILELLRCVYYGNAKLLTKQMESHGTKCRFAPALTVMGDISTITVAVQMP